MPDTTVSESAPPLHRLSSRVLGIVTAPRAAYAAVAERPRVAGVLLVVLAIHAGLIAAFLGTEVGRQAFLDAQIRTAESFGRTVSDAEYTRLEAMSAYAPAISAASELIGLTAGLLVISGVAAGVFGGVLGGRASFRQVAAIVAHSGLILALQQLVSVPLDYARQSLSSAANLALFLPMLDEGSFGARLLGSIDLFRVWWMVSLAIGLGVLYRRRTAPVAWTLLAIYAAIAVAIAIVQTVLTGA